MHTLWLSEKLKYTGEQLAPLYNYLEHGVLGDSIVGWRGACDIPFEHMIDGEDLRAESAIAGDDMIHLVLELFQFPLSAAVCLQRLMGELLVDEVKKHSNKALEMTRQGDDIYWLEKKFNISIASCSANSSLIHFAFNVSNQGTPVDTCALEDFAIASPEDFAQSFINRVKTEFLGIKRAMVKVRSF